MIQLVDVNFSYNQKSVLSNVNMAFATAHVHGIVGLNGSGKTTLFNVLAGIYELNSGQITHNNLPLSKHAIAYIDTETFFYPKLTAQEFLSVFEKTNLQFNEVGMAQLFNLPLDEFIENYSTGMKKKLLILSQIKQDKSIYIFDEPFNGLDVETNKLLILIIEMLAQKNKTIFISSHILEPLFNLCNQIHYLNNQKFEKTYLPQNFNTIDKELFGTYIDDLRTNLKTVF